MPARQLLEIETGAVVALTHAGDGIVREGKAVFVPGALPGELIRFRRRAQHRQYDDGLLVEGIDCREVIGHDAGENEGSVLGHCVAPFN